jgi:hypothetical protein
MVWESWEVRVLEISNAQVTHGRVDPRWANPIKNWVKQSNQARAIQDTLNPSRISRLDAGALGPLRVVNGMSTTTSSTLTTAARENVAVSPYGDGLPGRPGNSTIRWGGGLMSHPEVQEQDEDNTPLQALNAKDLPVTPAPKRTIMPSLATLEKAVSARIYFENLYFPLLRQTPSREQRRLAMERDMAAMQLTESERERLRARWRQNETEYLRERRRKVDASAFSVLQTIGHGETYPSFV